MDEIAILIPCYNESATIGKVVRDFRNAIPEAVIYVYDNNSSDKTDEIAREAGAIVRYERKQGKGNVIRSMFRQVDAKSYLMIDGDDTYPAEYAKEMVASVIDGSSDMVIGDRLSSTYFTENKRPFHNVGNKLVRGLIRFLFKSSVRDILTGYRAFSYAFVKTFPVLSKGFEIETEMTIHALDKNMNLHNVVVNYRDRPDGSESKLNTYTDGMRVLGTVVKLFKNYKPMLFFGLISFLFFVLGAVLFLPVLLDYTKTGLVERFPTLFASGFLVLAAIMSYFGGLQLSVILQQQKQDFEFKLKQVEEWKRERLKSGQKEVEHEDTNR